MKPQPDPTNPIRSYRLSFTPKMSYEAFGEMFDVDKTTARYWELKRVPAERAALVARKIGCHPSELRPDVFETPRRR